MEELYKTIEKLSGSEAKNLLINMMLRIKYLKDTKQLQENTAEELYSVYDELLGVSPGEEYIEREYSAVHIICGESAAGSLRVGLDYENKVIGFPDFFAVGPLWRLESKAGRQHRYEWLKNHHSIEMNHIEEEYRSRFANTLEEIEAIPAHIPIVIWTADNATDQTGIRYLLYLLKDRSNDVFLINATKAYQELFNTSEVQYLYIHTGEIGAEEFNQIYQKKLSVPLSHEARKQFQGEWRTLSNTTEVLRIWQNEKIRVVGEDYFDQLIIMSAEKIHAEQSEKDFIKAGQLVGELLGNMEDHVGDTFLEYRIRHLIYNGVFEIKGIPKGMLHYSVKLK